LLLIAVIILIGSLSASLTFISEDSFTLNEYVERTVEYQQIYEVSNLAVDAVREILASDSGDADYYGEMWTQNFTIPLENGSIQMVIIDQERFLNPNYLVDKNGAVNQEYKKVFTRLFEILNIDLRILDNIIDWIDRDDISSGGLEKYPDYPAKNDKMDSIEELKLIGGVSHQVFNGTITPSGFKPGLKNVLTVYSNGKVNVNTASKWVLMALDPDIDETLAAGIISYRKEKFFKNINDLNLVDGITGDIIHRISPFVDVKSENFLVELVIRLGERDYKIYFLMERKGKKITEKWRKIL